MPSYENTHHYDTTPKWIKTIFSAIKALTFQLFIVIIGLACCFAFFYVSVYVPILITQSFPLAETGAIIGLYSLAASIFGELCLGCFEYFDQKSPILGKIAGCLFYTLLTSLIAFATTLIITLLAPLITQSFLNGFIFLVAYALIPGLLYLTTQLPTPLQLFFSQTLTALYYTIPLNWIGLEIYPRMYATRQYSVDSQQMYGLTCNRTTRILAYTCHTELLLNPECREKEETSYSSL